MAKQDAQLGTPPVAVVVSRYNASITDRLLEGAARAYRQAGGAEGDLTVLAAPGAFELVAVSAAAARSSRFGAVVALGCVIKGETDHDKYINSAVAHGLAQISAETGLPVAFGLLTVNSVRQARERAGGIHGNKGEEAMVAALETARVIRSIGQPGAAALNGSVRPDKAAPSAARAGAR